MPFVKIWIHAVWSCKRRQPLLKQSMREELFKHIHQNAVAKGILIDSVNGYVDHVHCMFRLKNDQTISKVMQLIKGESSFWANKHKMADQKLVWQEEYFAVSISESQVNTVRKYILNQETHHAKQTFSEEYDEFIQKFEFNPMKNNA